MRRKFGKTPVFLHLGMQKILIYRGQLAGQLFIEQAQDIGITLHDRSLWGLSGQDYMRRMPVSWAVTPPCVPSANLTQLMLRVTIGAEFVKGRRVKPTSYATGRRGHRCVTTMCWSNPTGS